MEIMEKNVLSIWKPVGDSTHIIAKKVSEKQGVLTSHTGTLDPMAEGVIIVLLGEDRIKKFKYAEWKKEYEFDIVFGVSTDTYDGLGLVTKEGFSKMIDEKELINVLSGFKGDYIQKIPPYSAIKIKGKPLHWYARNNKLDEVTIPERNGEIFEIKLLELKEIGFEEIVEKMVANIKLITGDLRQEEITGQWEKYVDTNTTVWVARVRVKMTKGLYVRSLAVEIGEKLDFPAFTSSIVRTRNGEYSKKSSKTLEEVFGSNFRDKYNFVSRSVS